MNGSVAIVRAGMIGKVVAIELNRLGDEVTLSDRAELESRSAASFVQSGVSVRMGFRPAIATNLNNVHFAFGHGFTGPGAAAAAAVLVGRSLQSVRATNPQNSPSPLNAFARA